MKIPKFLRFDKTRRMVRLNRRAVELMTIPVIILGAVVVRMFMSFTTIFRASLLSWGVMDGFVSNYLYKHEKFFPYQFIRYTRIVANVAGIAAPIVPIVWNIGDGVYSVIQYKRQKMLEQMPRFGRIVNGGLLAVFS